ncbi:MAG: glycosyltransferase family 4 protein [Verrucomicrobiae bacterium]|nr:glycosyltransferase family 4 protein [Verrucomicrobiae bacterium]
MRLALVVHDFDPGLGQGRYGIELARRLAVRHRVEIVSSRFAVEREPGWEYRPVRAWRRTSLLTVFSFLAGATWAMRGRAYDVIHAQGLTCWNADVITAHVCNAARRLAQRPATVRERVFAGLVHPVEAAFYRQRRATHAIAVSARVAEELARHYGWRRPMSVIHHGIDTAMFRPPVDDGERGRCRARYGVGAGERMWLFVGEATKGLATAIEVLRDFPGVRLVAVTRSAAGWYAARAEELGVAGRLALRGPEVEVARAYRAADVFVYPSRYDAFGMVVAEAMASGLPVVVGRDIGAAEWVEDGVNGLKVDAGDGVAWREALKRLESDAGFGRRLGEAARRTAMSYSWDSRAAATEAVYEAVARLRVGDAGGRGP